MTASLWEFSLETYGRPGVQSACLNLQENMGMDVNILLYCCWRGAMEAEELETLMAELAPWQRDVVGGLRTVRRLMIPMIKELSEQSYRDMMMFSLFTTFACGQPTALPKEV